MRYIIKQKFFKLTDHFMVTDDSGRNCFMVKSKLLTIGKKLWICTPAGQEILFIKERLLHGFKRYDVMANGVMVAKIKKRPRLITKKLKVTSQTYGNYKVKGDPFAWSFSFIKEGQEVASTSKHILKIADSYTLDIASSERDYFIIAVAIVMDAIYNSTK